MAAKEEFKRVDIYNEISKENKAFFITGEVHHIGDS
jgi:hypothetical protein